MAIYSFANRGVFFFYYLSEWNEDTTQSTDALNRNEIA